MPERILIVSHGHPKFSKGGGEIAAYNLHREFLRQGHESVFLARHGEFGVNHFATPFGVLDENEVLLYTGEFDYFLFSQPYTSLIYKDFRGFLERFKPTVVHFHHYLHLGLEMIREVRRYSQDIPIVLTLHEYLAICNNQGQMIKTNQRLCWNSSPAECHVCLPVRSTSDYFLRELYIKSFFDLIDQFIAPSRFLKNRYIDWGLSESKITVMENGQALSDKTVVHLMDDKSPITRFAYFGQINTFKGLDLLIEAFTLLPKELKKVCAIDIFGVGLESQSKEFQEKVNGLLKDTKPRVRVHGGYEPHEVTRLMARADWIVMPSVWWENSPLVIQEAFASGRPVICADLGGMAEKVQDEVNGLHFRLGDPVDLAKILERAATEEGLWQRLASAISRPFSVEEAVSQCLAMYGDIRGHRGQRSETLEH